MSFSQSIPSPQMPGNISLDPLPGLDISKTPSSNITNPPYDAADVLDVPFFRPSSAQSRRMSLRTKRATLNGREYTHSPTEAVSVTVASAVPTPILERSERQERQERQERRIDRDSEPVMDFRARSPSTPRSRRNSASSSYETDATSLHALQAKAPGEYDTLEPLTEEDFDPGSFDLVAPVQEGPKAYSLESRSELLFSTQHLQGIFEDPTLLLNFTSFLSAKRSSSIPVLIYYLDAIKALKAISYANAIAEALEPIHGHSFTGESAKPTTNSSLEEKAKSAFEALVKDDLPAYITHLYIQTVSLSISKRIMGTLPIHLRNASEGLAEVFCLTDPSRPDNPIVFASEEFHRTTQYGMSYVIGRNCRFLQGPKTNKHSVARLCEKITAGQEHCEVFLNYRRDGSPFMNLLMIAPLCDSRGTIRYFIGAQVDVSGLVKECSDLEALKRIVINEELDQEAHQNDIEHEEVAKKDEFQELSEMLNIQELDTVRRWGGRMHKEQPEEVHDSNSNQNRNKPRVLIHDVSPDGTKSMQLGRPSGQLSGVYQQYLLVRPYPSLRILFASPSLRTPGILQSPLMDKIGGSGRVRDELTQALADGRGVTAKVRWVTKLDIEGRNRWIHCTPLLGNNGAIGVWMIVIVDDDKEGPGPVRRFRDAPPVATRIGRTFRSNNSDAGSLRDFAVMNGGIDSNSIRETHLDRPGTSQSMHSRGSGGGSPWTLRID